MDDYFNANDPETKRTYTNGLMTRCSIIFVLPRQSTKESFKESQKTREKVGLDQAAARTLEQKEKLGQIVRLPKMAKLNAELSQYNNKELKLAQLSNSNERPFFCGICF